MSVKKEIIVRFGFVYAVMLLIAVCLFFGAGYTVVKDGEFWREQGARLKKDSVPVDAKRGNILDCNGRLLAGSIPSSILYMDFRADGFEGNMIDLYVDTLASALVPICYKYKKEEYEKSKSKKYSEKEKENELKKDLKVELKAHILKEYKGDEKSKEEKNINLLPKNWKASYEEYKEIDRFPIIYENSNLFMTPITLKKKAFDYSMDNVSACFVDIYKGKSKDEMKAHLLKGYNKGSRRYLVNSQEVSYPNLKRIKENPFFSKGPNKSGLVAEERAKRKKPFGSLSSRTIGGLYAETGKGGSSGLEMKFDSLLKGKSGLSSNQKIAGKYRSVNEIDPVDGFDIKATIDVDIQDIVESALIKQLLHIDAEKGCAVVMEVKTGEIKAISNLTRQVNGTYAETQNIAVSSMTEPGSTFKIASVMVALEDGVIDTSFRVDTKDGKWKVFEKVKEMTDHNWRKGGYGEISIAQAIWHSSNIGISKMIYEYYRDKPERFVNRLYAMKLNEPLDLEIPGTGRPKIKHPEDKASGWSGISLPWISIGYETQIPPIYTLTFYNGIANNGKMIKPLFVKSICKGGEEIEQFSTKVINPSLCSQKTLKQVNQMLIDVVEKGTATAARSSNFRIAGKTGTAQLDYWKPGAKKKYQLSFCGFFPADAPQYSCIVVIWPGERDLPAGGNCGPVFKNIAERIYAQSPLLHAEPQIACDTQHIVAPVTKDGNLKDLQLVLDKLAIPHHTQEASLGKWGYTEAQKENVTMRTQKMYVNLVPNTIGMGAKDAIYLLENRGLQVRISGRGRVSSQSLPTGHNITKGETISLQLK